jgi:hypothetical protein
MTKLEKLRDELAINFCENWPYMTYGPKDLEAFYEAGFDAATAELMRVIEIQREAMQRFCDNEGYDDPSLIHKNCGHYIPRAMVEADAILNGEKE